MSGWLATTLSVTNHHAKADSSSLPWWVVIALGVAAVVAAAYALARRRRTLQSRAPYVRLSPREEPVDPLVRSQIAATLGTTLPGSPEPLQALRAWASGASHLSEGLEEVHRELRTLQTYVLDLDSRYLKRADAGWLALETCALVITIAGGVSATVWAVIDLAK